MNKEFVILDDKVVVSDDKGSLKELDNYDNITEILKEENIIEGIEEKIKKLNMCDENLKPIKGEVKKYIKMFLIPVLILLGSEITTRYIFHAPVPTVEIAIGNLSTPVAMAGFIAFWGGVFCGAVVLKQYLDNKDIYKRKNGYRKSIEYLNERLVTEKEELNELNNQKREVKTDNSKGQIMKLEESRTLEDIESEIKNIRQAALDEKGKNLCLVKKRFTR